MKEEGENKTMKPSRSEAAVIRKANRKDARVLAEFRYMMFSDMKPDEDLSRKRKRFVRESEAYYRSHVALKSQFDCVAMVSGRIVGCGSILFLDGPPHIARIGTRLGYILNVYVMKDYRRTGIATEIMKRLHREGSEHRIRRVSLHASEYGYHLYRKLGYEMNKMYLEKSL